MINLHEPIVAIIVISLTAFLMNIISGLLTKYLVYTPDFIQKKKEIERLKAEYEVLKRSGDKKKLKKYEKKLQLIKKMEAELSLKSFRPIIITMVVFFLIYMWLRTLYEGMGEFILLPFPLPIIGITSNFFWWYFISSLAFNSVTRPLFQPPS